MWRTLTNDEWRYLFFDRPDAANLRGQATVNDIHGYILLPDGWEHLSGLTFTSSPNDWTTNTYTKKQRSQMEEAGAMFLPTAGSRDGTVVTNVSAYGFYWSITIRINQEGCANVAYFYKDDARTYYLGRSSGTSVRLVQDVK